MMVSDHPLVYNRSRSTIFIEAYDQQLNTTAVHGLRHAYGKGRVLYFAEVRNRPRRQSCQAHTKRNKVATSLTVA